MSLIECRIVEEQSGEDIILVLTPEQLERAQRDAVYLQHLVDQEMARLAALNSNESSSIHQAEGAEENNGQHDQECRSLFIWNEACILLLLSLYDELKEDFSRKRHKTVFDAIARKMQETNSAYTVNGSQCQSKINSLKKQYKKIVDHNNTSGNDRATWPYFERMNELFGSAGWANPTALASEAGPELNENDPPRERDPKRRKVESVLEEYRNDMKKYRDEKKKLKLENFQKMLEMKERHHKEKMEILKSFCSNNNK